MKYKAIQSILSIVTLVFLFKGAHAQVDTKNHIFLELAGSGKIASVNYERFLYKNDVALRVGYSYVGDQSSALIGSLNYYFKTKSPSRFWQAGLGVTFSNADLTDVVGNMKPQPSYFYLVPTFGHKWTYSRNYTFQANVSPFINDEGLFPWGGISIGKQF